MGINNSYRFDQASRAPVHTVTGLSGPLEAMIDHYGLERVLFAVGHICGEKAEHIAVNWQDAHTAKPWVNMSTVLEQASKAAKACGV